MESLARPHRGRHTDDSAGLKVRDLYRAQAQLGQQLVTVGNNFRFDMSDQAPAAFGGTPNKGEWADLQTFLGNGNISAAQTALEADAVAAGPWS